jgi:hypothetical protein
MARLTGRTLLRAGAGVAAVLAAGAAHADPGTAIAFAMAVFNPTVVTIALAVASVVFGQEAKRKRRNMEADARRNHNASLQDRMVSVLATNSPWRIVYGTAEVAGSLEVILTSGSRDEYQHLVMVLAAHECHSIDDIRINGESLGALDGSGFPTSGKYFRASTETVTVNVAFNGAGQGTLPVGGAALVGVVLTIPSGSEFDSFETSYPGATLLGTTISGGPISQTAKVTYTRSSSSGTVRVQKHLGSDIQAADATLLAECPTEWGASDQFRGLTYIVVRLDLNEAEFQGGPPQITAVVKGKKVYDHRTGLTVWSANAAVCVADFLTAPYGKDARTNQVSWDTVDAAANACDEVVTIGSWSGPRFTCNGTFTSDGDTDQTLDELLGSMAGWADGGGYWRIGAGVWTAPVTSITDDDNAGAVQIAGGEGIDDLFNGVRGQFNDPARFGVATDYAPYQSAVYAAEDGRPMWTDMPLPYTNDETRARNLARIAVERLRGETLVYPAKLKVLNRVKVGQRVTMFCSALGISGTTYRLQQREEQPGGLVNLTFKQDVAANYDLVDAASPLPGSYNPLPDPFAIPPPVGLAAFTGDGYSLIAGSTVIPRIYVNVAGDPQQAQDRLQIQWRTSTMSDWQELTVASGQQGAYIEGVSQGFTYFVRARWTRPSLGAVSDWRTTGIKVAGKLLPPSKFDVFTVTTLGSGTRRYTFGYTVTPPPVDWVGAEIRYIAGTVPTPTWNLMTPLNAYNQAFTSSPIDSATPGAGTWTFACRSRDSGGLATDMNVVTVTLGPPPADLYVVDLTPPPTPTGLAASVSAVQVQVVVDPAVYTVGHGHGKTIVYGAYYSGVGPQPVFGDAIPIGEFTGQVASFPVEPGLQIRLWAKWRSIDGGLSAAPAGGTNGLSATADLIDTANIASLNASKIIAGTITTDKLTVNAATVVASAAAVGNSNNALGGTTGGFVVGSTACSLTTTGAPLSITLHNNFTAIGTNPAIAFFYVITYLMVDGVLEGTNSDGYFPAYAMAAIGEQIVVRRLTPSAGAHTLSLRTYVESRDASGNVVSMGGSGSANQQVYGIATENKI